jgi:hypothetical protein
MKDKLNNFFEEQKNDRKNILINREKVIKNSFLTGFRMINRYMNNEFDNLLFSCSSKMFFFDSFMVIKNSHHDSIQDEKELENENYTYYINDVKKEIKVSSCGYQVIDYTELSKSELKFIGVKKDGSINYDVLTLGNKTYKFDVSLITTEFNKTLIELLVILNSEGNKIRKSDENNRIEEEGLSEQERLNELKESQSTLLSEFDKDGNGEVDVIGGNDFNLLLKKHQKSIIKIDRNYVHQFVKVSSYLKAKEKNIQSIFNSIKDTPTRDVLNEYVELLRDDINSYNLTLLNSLNMIVSLVEDDMITFYEIHEMLDTLNMFDSKHEKDISRKLTNIGDGFKDLMDQV